MLVLAALHEDVIWANGMEGGHVHEIPGVGPVTATARIEEMDQVIQKTAKEKTAKSLGLDGDREIWRQTAQALPANLRQRSLHENPGVPLAERTSRLFFTSGCSIRRKQITD